MKVIVVYYIFINPHKNWKSIVEGQLNDLNGLDYDLFVHICSNEFISECEKIIKSYKNEVTISTSNLNLYEYPGIKLLYELSQSNPESILFYMHSKGMVFSGNDARSPTETLILRNTIKDHKNTLKLFEDKNINKIGLIPHEENYIISNFFWVRASYIKVPPIITDDRFYYERYIGNIVQLKENINDCYSLLANEITTFDFEKVKRFKNSMEH
jgi:hypothetical protein